MLQRKLVKDRGRIRPKQPNSRAHAPNHLVCCISSSNTSPLFRDKVSQSSKGDGSHCFEERGTGKEGAVSFCSDNHVNYLTL